MTTPGPKRAGEKDMTMNTRTKTGSVTFSRPFFLDEIDRELPAGAYAVEVEEEMLDGVTFVGYRRVGTRMTVPSRAGTGMETWLIRPDALEAALERDRGVLARD